MKKLIAQYPDNRSSTKKYDPCQNDKFNLKQCPDCRVFTIADPFISNKLKEHAMPDDYKFPYVLITETVGCNLRCWFCYSHHCWSESKAKKKNAKPIHISSEELAKQFKCKINKISKSKRMDNRPIAKLRITGGEPIYSTSNIINPYKSNKKIDYKIGIDYWIDYIKRINTCFKNFLEKNKINFSLIKDWSTDYAFPTFLGDEENRINIRFDTNGVAFSSSDSESDIFGGKDIANYFIDKLFELHQNNELDFVKIWITYSLKGTSKNEFYWSQGKKLPTNIENIGFESNPQLSGIENLNDRIDYYTSKDEEFLKVVDITVEKGIEHDLNHSTYLYNRKALDWKSFEKNNNVKLSDVKNNITLVYRYGGGKWGVLERTPGLAKRYFNQGAEIKAVSDKDEFVGSGSYSQAEKLSQFINENYKDDDFHVIIRPGIAEER